MVVTGRDKMEDIADILTQDGDAIPGVSAIEHFKDLFDEGGPESVPALAALKPQDRLFLFMIDRASPFNEDDPLYSVVVAPSYWARTFPEVERKGIVESLFRLLLLDFIRPKPGVHWWGQMSHPRWRPGRSADLRAMPYSEYLMTPEWRCKREAMLDKAGRRCQLCSSPRRLHVHHRTYERRGEEQPEDLIVLCAQCHELFHRR